MIVLCKNGSNTGANQQDNLLTEEDPCKFIDTFEWECWLYELYWLFPPGLGTLLLQCLQTIATRPTHIFNPSLIMNSMVLPMWCCITGLVFAFSGISLWSLDDDYENCATGCTVSDDVAWLSKYRGNSGEPTLLLHSSRGQMCK